ncbi:MAG TPA: membrane protein insertase YidC, partial [Hyphomicrobiaceae bacterium]|nr:membrane protein insertase YidC [Hyphomicrobiaceae bacterium]
MSTRDPENSQNVLIALVLSMLVLFAWQYFYAGPKIDADKAKLAQKSPDHKPTEGAAPQPMPSTPQGTPGAPSAAPVAPPVAGTAMSRQAALTHGPRVTIDTPSLKGSIPLKGARIDDIVLAKYRETVDPKSPNVILFSPVGTPSPYFAEFGWVADAASNIKVPDRDTVWTQEGSSALTPDAPVTLSWTNGSGLTFKRTIAVDQNYLF